MPQPCLSPLVEHISAHGIIEYTRHISSTWPGDPCAVKKRWHVPRACAHRAELCIGHGPKLKVKARCCSQTWIACQTMLQAFVLTRDDYKCDVQQSPGCLCGRGCRVQWERAFAAAHTTVTARAMRCGAVRCGSIKWCAGTVGRHAWAVSGRHAQPPAGARPPRHGGGHAMALSRCLESLSQKL